MSGSTVRSMNCQWTGVAPDYEKVLTSLETPVLTLVPKRYAMMVDAKAGLPVVTACMAGEEEVIEGMTLETWIQDSRELLSGFDGLRLGNTREFRSMSRYPLELDITIKEKQVTLKDEELAQWIEDLRRVVITLDNWELLHACE